LVEEKKPKSLFCYTFKIKLEEVSINGWDIYSVFKEFTRQGALNTPEIINIKKENKIEINNEIEDDFFKKKLKSRLGRGRGSDTSKDYFFKLTDITINSVKEMVKPQKSGWRLSLFNENNVCETYPKYVIVPGDITDQELLSASSFRSKKRIPVLSYYDSETGASITRSSQPFVGFTVGFGIGNQKTKGVKDDIKLINSIIKTNKKSTTSKKLKILDLRPRINAEANR
jgi:hypothetical protein